MQWRARERRLTGAERACGDLRRRRHRSLPRLFPRAARPEADRRRAGRGRLRRVGQVPRLPGARLVRRHPARASRSPQLRASREPRRGASRRLGYRRMTTYAGYGGSELRGAAGRHRLPWLSEGVILTDRLGTPETTAQVDPGRFTRAMMRAAAAHGAELRRAAVTGIARRDGNGAAVETDEGAIPTDVVVIAMGPWSRLA